MSKEQACCVICGAAYTRTGPCENGHTVFEEIILEEDSDKVHKVTDDFVIG